MSVQPVRRYLRVFSHGLTAASLVVMAAFPGRAANWVPATGNLASMASECGNLCRIFPVPNSDKVIAGVAGVGMWVTTNGGALWSKLGGSDSQIRNRPRNESEDLQIHRCRHSVHGHRHELPRWREVYVRLLCD
jgi:hypothetical protein